MTAVTGGGRPKECRLQACHQWARQVLGWGHRQAILVDRRQAMDRRLAILVDRRMASCLQETSCCHLDPLAPLGQKGILGIS